MPTSICAMRSNSSTNVWLRCVQVDDDDDDARTPPPTPEAAGTTAGGDVVAVRETPVAADGGVKGGSSGSKSNIGRSRSKSTSNDDSDDNDDDGDGDVVDDDVVAAEAVDGQTVAESRSNSDENVKIGGGDKGNADVRSQPNRSSRMDDVVASSSAERTESPKCSPKSAGRDGVASRRSEPSSRAPGRSSRTRQGVDGAQRVENEHGAPQRRLAATQRPRQRSRRTHLGQTQLHHSMSELQPVVVDAAGRRVGFLVVLRQ